MTAPTLSAPADLVRAIKNKWRHGQAVDILGVLADHPELQADKDTVLEFIYEALFLSRVDERAFDVNSVCEAFPQWASSIRRMLVVDQDLGSHPSWCDKVKPLKGCWPAPGEQLGRFKLIRVLGEGTFSCVYLATEAAAGDRPVAVKVSKELGSGEANTLGRLHHDNVVPILWADRDQTTNLHVVCMPFLGSTTLNDVLFAAYPRLQGPPPLRGAVITETIRSTIRVGDPKPDRCLSGPDLSRLSYVAAILRLAESLADTLAFLHERNLAHSDLKPSNILLTPTGRPMLLDFNLSTSANAPALKVGGTPRYMSPEMLAACLEKKPLPVEAVCRADLYSLAVIVYELLTGRHPLDIQQPIDLEDEELVRWFIEQQPRGTRPLRELNPAVPPRIARLLHGCLSADPLARPASAAVLVAELRRHRRRLVKPALIVACSLLLLLGSALVGVAAMRPAVHTVANEHPLTETTVGAVQVPAVMPAALRAAAERHLTEGWQLLGTGRANGSEHLLREADQLFANAIDAHIRQTGAKHGAWQDYAGRGRAKMLLGTLGDAYQGNFTEAQSQFVEAERCIAELDSDQQPPRSRVAQLWACRSYCYSRSKIHHRAVLLGEKAASAGFRSAALLNNVGHSYLRRSHLEKAEFYLTQARQTNQDLLPALRNLTLLALEDCAWKLQHRQAGQTGQPVTVPSWVLHQLDEAIPNRMKKGAEPAELYRKAASLYQRLGDRVRARQYVQMACSLGVNPADLKDDLVYRDDPSLKAWLASPEAALLRPRSVVPSLNLCLVDPLDSPFP
jgi:serine/threonine protein kinase/tetratricopeptide (TPR) repeat protein